MSLADPGGVQGVGVQGGVSGGSNPPLKNNVKGLILPKVHNYFLTVVLNLQEMHSIFTKNYFFPMPPLPP